MEKHINAEVCLLADVPEPKFAGVVSGYAPTHHFLEFPELVSGFQDYGDDAFHYPGETMLAKIGFPSWHFIKHRIRAGDTFTFYEGGRLIGRGKVLQVLG